MRVVLRLMAAFLCVGSFAPTAGAQSVTTAVVVELVDESGAPVPGARVWFELAGAPAVVAVWNPETARYESASLPPGPGTLAVEIDGFDRVRRPILVRPGGGSATRVVVQPAAVVDHVRVIGAATPAGDTATRLASTPLDTPRSVTVIGASRIREQQFQSVTDALAYVPGMSVNSYRTGSYHFYSRGYRMGPEDTRVDGFVGLNAGGRYGGSMFGVEDVVFLRGPAGILYGSAAAPGGLVNLVSKQPRATPMTAVDLRTRTFAGQGIRTSKRISLGLDVDTTGPLARSPRLQYRALVTGERMKYFTDGVDDDNRYASALVRMAWGPHAAHSVTPAVTWMRFARPHGGGLVVSPSTSLSTADGVRGPIHTDDLSPLAVNHSAGGGTDEVLQAGADARGAVGGSLQYAVGYRFVANDTVIDQFAPQVDVRLLQSAHLLPRAQAKSRAERRYHNVDARLDRDLVSSDPIRMRVQLGVTGRRTAIRGTSPLGAVPGPQAPIDIYTGIAAAPLADTHPALALQPWTDATYWTTYVQQQTALAHERVVLTVGLGYGENRLAAGQAVRRSGLMPNAAVVVKARPDVSVYASYATSYTPPDPAAEDGAGGRGGFDPALGRNLEFGVKGEYRRATWAAAAFHNDLGNTLVQSGPNDLNPNGVRYYVAAGTRRSRGAELSAETSLADALHLTGSVTYLDAIYTGAGPASATLPIPGSRAEKSPRWAWNVWTRFAPATGRLARTSAAVGLVHQGGRVGSNGPRTTVAPDPLDLPAFTRLDLTAGYRIGRRVDLGVHVENALDALIFVNAGVGSSIEVAPPRQVSVRLGFRY